MQKRQLICVQSLDLKTKNCISVKGKRSNLHKLKILTIELRTNRQCHDRLLFVVEHIKGYMTSKPGSIINHKPSIDYCHGGVRETGVCS